MPSILSSSSERRYVLPLLIAEPGRLASTRVLAHPAWVAGSRDRAAHPPVGEDELEERLRPGLDAELAQWLQLLRVRRVADEPSTTERHHHNHAKLEFLGERQKVLRDRRLGGVV